MKTILLSVCILFVSFQLYPQGCKDSPLTLGKKLKIETNTYPLTLEVLGAGLFSMKQKEKDAKIAEHKANILSGKQAATKATFDYVVSNVSTTGNNTEYEISTEIGGQTYKSYVMCSQDTFYCYRIKGVQWSVYNNDTIGFALLGVQMLPYTMKVGDIVPGYIDIGQGFPATETKKITHSFYENETNPLQSSYTTYYGQVTSDVTYTYTSAYIKIHQGGTVIGEEDITISGKTYKSYIIGTEVWTKFGTNIDVAVEEKTYFNDPALSKKINKSFQKAYDKGGKRLDAKINEITGANEQGYTVSYKEEWIVPGIGTVKGINYDQFGCINSIAYITGLE